MIKDPNKELVRQLFLQIKSFGYTTNKDELGYYFNKDENRFSLMFCGPLFHCYFNKQKQGTWELQTKKMNFATMLDSLVWISQIIKTQK